MEFSKIITTCVGSSSLGIVIFFDLQKAMTPPQGTPDQAAFVSVIRAGSPNDFTNALNAVGAVALTDLLGLVLTDLAAFLVLTAGALTTGALTAEREIFILVFQRGL